MRKRMDARRALGVVPSLVALSVAASAGSAAAGERSVSAKGQPGGYAQIAQMQGQQQQQQGQQPRQQQASNWTYAAGASLHYDTFESDDNLIESDQLTELFNFTAGRSNLWYPGDSLSLSLNLGFVQAWPERAGNKDSVYATPTDIQLGASYSTWDKKTSGVTAKLFLNLPTGPTDLSLTELAAIPNPKLVSGQVLSEGLQIGGQAQYHRQIEKWHVRGGLGYTYRSGISGFDNFRANELSGGHDISVLAGADYQLNERLNLGISTQYVYSIEERGGDNHYVGVTVPLTYLYEGGEVSLAYTFSYSSGENRELTRVRGEDDSFGFLDGLRHSLALDVGYRVAPPFLLTGMAEVSVGDSGRSNDPAFFTTDDYFVLGVGGTYTLAQNISLQGLVKYFEVSTKGANGGTTTFDGGSAMLGLKYGF